MLYELWGDERSARKTRLAVAALIVIAIAIGATAPAGDASRVVFVSGSRLRSAPGSRGPRGRCRSGRDGRRARADQRRRRGRRRGGRPWSGRCARVPVDRGRGRRGASPAPARGSCRRKRVSRRCSSARSSRESGLLARRRARGPAVGIPRRAGAAAAHRAGRAGGAPAGRGAAREGGAGARRRVRRADASRTRDPRRARAFARGALDPTRGGAGAAG